MSNALRRHADDMRCAPTRSPACAPAASSRSASISLLVSLLVAALWIASIVLTFGLALFFLPPLFPIVAFFYNGLTVSGRNMATPGMRAMDLEMRMHDTGARVPFINAAVQAVLFYVSWFFPPIFLVSLVDARKALPARHPRRRRDRPAALIRRSRRHWRAIAATPAADAGGEREKA